MDNTSAAGLESIGVLSIEDDGDFVLVIRKFLELCDSARFDVVSAVTLAEGLSLLSTRRFDVILLDLDLPDSHGVETLSRILQTTGTLPVLVLSESYDRVQAAEFLRLGAQEYLEKLEVNAGVLSRSVLHAIERKNLSRRLDERDALYHALLENAPAAILLADTETGRYLEANEQACALIGCDMNELLSGDIGAFTTPGNIPDTPVKLGPGFRDLVRKMPEGKVISREWIVRNAAGREIPCDARFLKFSTGGKSYLRISYVDISDIKRREEQLVQMDKLTALGEIAAGVAHEIAQPLMGITLAAENMLLQDQEAGTSNVFMAQKAKDILEMVSRIRSIAEHIRVFSREHRQDISQPFSVHTAIDNAVKLFRTHHRNRDIRLTLTYCPDFPYLWGNMYRFEQVILDLLSNSRYAVEEKQNRLGKSCEKLIEITTSVGEAAVIELRDNGIGMNRETLDRIFDPFFTTKPVEEGTGLGLSIALGIVRSMNGTIEFDSIEGEYTRVRIAFDVKAMKETAIADYLCASAASSTGSRPVR